MSKRDMPMRFRPNGVLWWYQVLTTFFVRVRGPLAHRLETHEAMRPFLGPTAPVSMRFPTRKGSPAGSWLPSASFDYAMHIRMGDACGAKADHEHVLRKCVTSLPETLAKLNLTGGASLYVASDSQKAIEDVVAAAPSLTVHWLKIDRAKYNTSRGVEESLDRRDSSALEEALMELLLISRSRTILGSMTGNMPRLAVQLRVMPPGTDPPYISLDNNDWCTCTSCKPYFVQNFDGTIKDEYKSKAQKDMADKWRTWQRRALYLARMAQNNSRARSLNQSSLRSWA